MLAEPAVYLITGVMAAGKSTVAQALAERLPRSVHLRGDLFRRMIVNGRVEITPELTDAVRQLRLRCELAAQTTDTYVAAGFTVVIQDVVLEDYLVLMTELIRSRPLRGSCSPRTRPRSPHAKPDVPRPDMGTAGGAWRRWTRPCVVRPGSGCGWTPPPRLRKRP